MKEYKKGDKVVIEIRNTDRTDKVYPYNVGKGFSSWIGESDILGKLEDFQSKPEKIKFTAEMKEEFDELKQSFVYLKGALEAISDSSNKYAALKEFLMFSNRATAEQDIVRAWYDQSLIEVVEPKKYAVKVATQMLEKNDVGTYMFISGKVYQHLLTLDEVKEAEKQLGIQGLQAKWHEVDDGNKK